MDTLIAAARDYIEDHPREDGDVLLAIQIVLEDLEHSLRDELLGEGR
jgi:hypothetical protein